MIAAARIAKAALDKVPDRGLGPPLCRRRDRTAGEMLPADRPLTVVTNALSIASILLTRPNTTIVFVGGRIDRRRGAAVDSWALHQISQSFVEVLIT
jgi:DeoR family fructose operon transcriptional repressor